MKLRVDNYLLVGIGCMTRHTPLEWHLFRGKPPLLQLVLQDNFAFHLDTPPYTHHDLLRFPYRRNRIDLRNSPSIMHTPEAVDLLDSRLPPLVEGILQFRGVLSLRQRIDKVLQ